MDNKKYLSNFVSFFLKKFYIAVAILVFFGFCGLLFLRVNKEESKYTASQKIVINAFDQAPASYVELFGLEENHRILSEKFKEYSPEGIKSGLLATLAHNSRVVSLSFTGKDKESVKKVLEAARELSINKISSLFEMSPGLIKEVADIEVKTHPRRSGKKILFYFMTGGLAFSMFVIWVMYDFDIYKKARNE